MSYLLSLLPGPLRLLAGQPSLLFDLTSDGPIRYISRQKFTGFPEIPPALCLSGVRVLITGGTSGLGLEAARKFLHLGADISIGARNMDKAQHVKRKLLDEMDDERDSRISLLPLEMKSLNSVDEFVEKLRKESCIIDIVVLNAGGLSWENPNTDDGWSHNMQINFISTAYLARRLVPLLSRRRRHSTESNHSVPSRLVLVTSEGHAWSTFCLQRDAPVLSVMEHGYGKSRFSPEQDYYTAKLFLALFGRELARRVDPKVLTVVSMSPGFCASNFFPDSSNLVTRIILSLQARSLDQGANLQVHAATCPADDSLSGAYLRDGQRARLSTFAESSEGEQLQGRLWKEVDDLLLARNHA